MKCASSVGSSCRSFCIGNNKVPRGEGTVKKPGPALLLLHDTGSILSWINLHSMEAEFGNHRKTIFKGPENEKIEDGIRRQGHFQISSQTLFLSFLHEVSDPDTTH